MRLYNASLGDTESRLIHAMGGPEHMGREVERSDVQKQPESNEREQNPDEAPNVAKDEIAQAESDANHTVESLLTQHRKYQDILTSLGDTKNTNATEAKRQLVLVQDKLSVKGISVSELGMEDPTGNVEKSRKSASALIGKNITITHPAGSTRHGRKTSLSYGHAIARKDSGDGELADVWVNGNPEGEYVYAIKQIPQTLQDGTKINDPETKYLVGFSSQGAAVNGYLGQYPDGWKAGAVTAIKASEFGVFLDGNNAN